MKKALSILLIVITALTSLFLSACEPPLDKVYYLGAIKDILESCDTTEGQFDLPSEYEERYQYFDTLQEMKEALTMPAFLPQDSLNITFVSGNIEYQKKYSINYQNDSRITFGCDAYQKIDKIIINSYKIGTPLLGGCKPAIASYKITVKNKSIWVYLYKFEARVNEEGEYIEEWYRYETLFETESNLVWIDFIVEGSNL